MTLIELVITLVVISLIGGIISTKISSPASLTIGQQADLFANDIRHAQLIAQTWGCQLKIVVSSSAYEVRNKAVVPNKPKCSSADTVIIDPAKRQNFSTTLRNNVQFSAGSTFDFDLKGRPLNTATDALLTTPVSLTLSGGGNTYNFSISHHTGYISMSGP